MKTFLPLLVFLTTTICTFAEQVDRTPIWLFSPTGWIISVAPDGSGRVFRLTPPSANCAIPKGILHNYNELFRELKTFPDGSSPFAFAFVDGDHIGYFQAPDLKSIRDTFDTAHKYISNRAPPDFQNLLTDHPLLEEDTNETEPGAAANP